MALLVGEGVTRSGVRYWGYEEEMAFLADEGMAEVCQLADQGICQLEDEDLEDLHKIKKPHAALGSLSDMCIRHSSHHARGMSISIRVQSESIVRPSCAIALHRRMLPRTTK